MKKKVLLLLTLAILVLTFVGCGVSEEEKNIRANYETKAKENALAYVKEKYDISAEIVSAECETTGAFGKESSGMVFVELKYDGQSFDVYITGESDTSTAGYDNYQSKAIEKAIKTNLGTITDNKTSELRITYGVFKDTSISSRKYGLVRTYYTGDNLAEVIGGNNAAIIYHTTYTKLNSLTTDKLSTSFGKDINIYLIGYESNNKLKSVKSADYSLGIDDNKLEDTLLKNYVLCKDYVEYKNGKLTYTYANAKSTSYDNIIYYINKDKTITFSNCSMDNVENWGSKYSTAVALTNPYSISGSNTVNIWLPCNKLNTTNYNKIKVLYSYTNSSGNKTYYKTLTPEVIGNKEYVYFQLPKEKNIKFIVAVTK